jgi:hypothetical protein
VKEITTGIPAARAARVTPIASGIFVIVRALTKSASAALNEATCTE